MRAHKQEQGAAMEYAPWHIANSNARQRVRINISSRLLNQAPCTSLPRNKVRQLPRQNPLPAIISGYTHLCL